MFDIVHNGVQRKLFLLRALVVGGLVPQTGPDAFQCIGHVIKIRECSSKVRGTAWHICQLTILSTNTFGDGVIGALM